MSQHYALSSYALTCALLTSTSWSIVSLCAGCYDTVASLAGLRSKASDAVWFAYFTSGPMIPHKTTCYISAATSLSPVFIVNNKNCVYT